jgi:dihydroneopterin aldolase
MIVVKLGGSLAEGDGLRRWLAAVAAGRGRVVLVPGGGVFADAVRREQQRHGFSDSAAHRMSLLAMEQYAAMLADFRSDIVPSRSLSEIRDTLTDGAIPIWLPAAMVLTDPAIAESWDVTSDSLAAWLAGRLEVGHLALVKSVAAPRPLSVRRLADRGAVDRAFPEFVARAGVALHWFGPGEEDRLAGFLAG